MLGVTVHMLLKWVNAVFFHLWVTVALLVTDAKQLAKRPQQIPQLLPQQPHRAHVPMIHPKDLCMYKWIYRLSIWLAFYWRVMWCNFDCLSVLLTVDGYWICIWFYIKRICYLFLAPHRQTCKDWQSVGKCDSTLMAGRCCATCHNCSSDCTSADEGFTSRAPCTDTPPPFYRRWG